jgi:hypothetical protein
VTTQTLTDWLDAAYAIIGLSGTLEVAGLAWWGIGLLVLIRRGRLAEAADDRATGPAPALIEAGHHPADVLGWFPETAPVFDRFGFTALRSPALRRTVGRRATLAQAARLRGIESAVLVEALNAAIVREPQAGCQPDELVQIG